MIEPKEIALRKHSQIAKANRTMFIWVASVSVVVGVALVLSVFLVQRIIFNEKILAEKANTVTTLKSNNSVITELEAQVRVLDNNQALISTKAKPTDQAIQVILDALPSEANSLALGASLQNKLLSDVEGLIIESLQVDPVPGVESAAATSSSSASKASGEITFRFSVSGDEPALKQALERLERSIRTIDVVMLTIESQGTKRVMTVEAKAFYEPTREVIIKDKVIKS